MEKPYINVGIVTGKEISFTLNGKYLTQEGEVVTGQLKASATGNGEISLGTKKIESIELTPEDNNCSFTLHNVTIGISYHWERQEEQTFTGKLKLITDGENVIAINILPVEDYLVSVISSEMSATSSLEFLKSHAVISRSWLLAQIENRDRKNVHKSLQQNFTTDENCIIRWYDREDHKLFDVCADDHCQRYQGITKASNPSVAKAVKETEGMVLMYGDEICDARFSKCCGGVSETFDTCWEDKDYPYLQPVIDNSENNDIPDLSIEENAEKWIRTTPAAFCNTHDEKVLKQILNNYDQETTDFYRWKVKYSQKEISELIHRKTSIEFGDIKDLIPMQRGKSGRISRLKIVGTLRTVTIGKELEIRRALSESHLFSSAFVIDKTEVAGSVPSEFTITGAGWGHGVGLCQIGAAMMGEKGYSYDKILLHYYRNAEIKKVY
ncbi:SpoIID/LytB domain-containing protein [Bacteroides sp. ET336]|uniref:SpoIID/LytB domain-containing protein n=1 Tax=Bacteroides sp. ET336 TaxID=2972459 RepID=UPI0021AC3A2E|nr:SpoIID/LytB domain-containing protein [Bacteroides sp. ET336]MCR8892982.1 SpoIID/LytB domain-containing protein [Bacteroides sp. ET336]MDN0057479.1 SpoIID/LytB domain-containing protein [Bacteroides caecigallinarum]